MAIILALFICFGVALTFYQTIKSFENNESLFQKISGIIVVIMMTSFVVAFVLGYKEEIQYQTMKNYFEGKVEVIEQVDTIRTFKFTHNEKYKNW